MTRLDHLLVILKEEAAEVIQEASKCLRFGVDEVYPAIGFSNQQRVVDEFNDLYAVMAMLQKEGLFEDGFLSDEKIRAKQEKVEKNLLYSEKCGRLDDEPVKASVRKTASALRLRQCWVHEWDTGEGWKSETVHSLEAHLKLVGLSDGFTHYVEKEKSNNLGK